jgi:hypothetical protein
MVNYSFSATDAKRQLRDQDMEKIALRANNHRLEIEVQKQNVRLDKLIDPRFATGKEAQQTRKELEKHAVIQQLKKQVHF